MTTARKALMFGLAIAGTSLLLPSTTEAAPAPGFDFDFGIHGRHGGLRIGIGGSRYRSRGCDKRVYRRHHHRPVHRHHYRAHYERVWVPPVYRSVFVGYDSCGRARYRNVCVRNGYYRRVLRGHRCSCGHYR